MFSFICVSSICDDFILVVHCWILQSQLKSSTYLLIYSFSSLFKVSQGDIGHAVGLLTTEPAKVQDPGEPQESGTSGEAWESQKGTLGMQTGRKPD